MAKYSKKSQEMVESAMHRRKKGTLKSGKSGKTVTSRNQAIAIGLSEAREKGAKVPSPKAGSKSSNGSSKKSSSGNSSKNSSSNHSKRSRS